MKWYMKLYTVRLSIFAFSLVLLLSRFCFLNNHETFYRIAMICSAPSKYAFAIPFAVVGLIAALSKQQITELRAWLLIGSLMLFYMLYICVYFLCVVYC